MKRPQVTAPLLLALLMPGIAFAQDDMWDDEEWGDEQTASRWSGFVEAGFGTRFSRDPLLSKRNTLEELRWRLESDWQPGKLALWLKGDVAYDGISESLEADFRDLTAAFTIGKSLDVKLGRQVQTWGTGDLVFLNDLFPKDFQSFFSGRDDEYLKAPGNALRLTRFSSFVNVDFVWTPEFAPDIYLTGERFSFFSPLAGGNIAPQPPLKALEPGSSLANGELALRLFKNVDGREYAVYLYDGFFKQPMALTEDLQPTFAPMTAVGASLRQALGRGLINIETSVYLSRDDRNGSNPLLPNDQLRVLVGYEWEAKTNLTVGLQYYLEKTLDYGSLVANSPFPEYEADEHRHLITNRLTYRAGRDKHTWSLFTFFSPSDRDIYLRPAYNYRHDDHWSVAAGASLFEGDKPHTFFSQLQDASNAYLRIRYNY
jgi:hypothetical protein